ncbi:MAG: zeta toxin family protein [Clostridia bacterium]|nr:zeta toxin family protein [Clostridia bacterium]
MPRLLVLAGPNGSGKSTVTEKIEIVGKYVNADEIKRKLGCSDLEAAETAENTREYLLDKKEDFTFETVLSTPRNINLMKRAKETGYQVVCIYVLTCDPEINIKRVKNRVSKGGHGVPLDKIRKRYKRALRLFPNLFPICDELYVFDNSKDSSEGSPALIMELKNNLISVFDNEIWSFDMITGLICGDYPDKYL